MSDSLEVPSSVAACLAHAAQDPTNFTRRYIEKWAATDSDPAVNDFFRQLTALVDSNAPAARFINLPPPSAPMPFLYELLCTLACSTTLPQDPAERLRRIVELFERGATQHIAVWATDNTTEIIPSRQISVIARRRLDPGYEPGVKPTIGEIETREGLAPDTLWGPIADFVHKTSALVSVLESALVERLAAQTQV